MSAMELMGPEEELSLDYKLVPWSSWDQWNFVRECIFSSSPNAVTMALQRISTWRSRGCLPIPIHVTASIVKIQQKDFFFRSDLTDGMLESDEMLSMLYSMAIIRFVNCFVGHKKTKFSIAELADAIGIPRVLVDIRHESSHRDLPSLQRVRHASVKALDWLKFNYWEAQKNRIPDVRKVIRSKLLEMTCYLKTKNVATSSGVKQRRLSGPDMLRAGNKLSSRMTTMLQSSKSNRSQKPLPRITKIIARLYSSYPSEVVSVLLELFHLQTPGSSDNIDVENSIESDAGNQGSANSLHDLKTIITRLSSKKPRLLLSLLRKILETIEIRFAKSLSGECDIHLSQIPSEVDYLTNLCSLVRWLIMNLKSLKGAGFIQFDNEAEAFSIHKNKVQVSLHKLIRKCLTLSLIGNQHLCDSVLLLVEMTEDSSVKERLKKLPLLNYKAPPAVQVPSYSNTESMLLKEEDAICHATEKLAILKSKIKARSQREVAPGVDVSDTDTTWTVAKSWISCPIGMLPCSFSSTPVLPVLDQVDIDTKAGLEKDNNLSFHASDYRQLVYPSEMSVAESPNKKLKTSQEVQCTYFPESTRALEGRLLINGVWTKASEEELSIIQSQMRIFA
ncbi:uncharacterized protein LOC121967379 [Zingiber officinale]|uniref:uncharacterized protein LOC121967379 n=1 Tax=Zingiber officinale TaxID=94328 RepID=UPI001C4B1993|nr:uncharacterized protein LOC121967379 [Zingiber officinale]